jgi:hypothetical protein
LVPGWVDTMDVVVLLSSFLILGLHGESASSQSHQNQKGLRNNILNSIRQNYYCKLQIDN